MRRIHLYNSHIHTPNLTVSVFFTLVSFVQFSVISYTTIVMTTWPVQNCIVHVDYNVILSLTFPKLGQFSSSFLLGFWCYHWTHTHSLSVCVCFTLTPNYLTRITVANQVGSIPLDWALGAFILQSTADLAMGQSDWITTVIGDDSPTLLSLIAIFIILLFTAWSISKWRKPQLKTIYDLEKGRYIVTRVNRYWW